MVSQATVVESLFTRNSLHPKLFLIEMSTHDENSPPQETSSGQRRCDSALHLGPRKKPFVYLLICVQRVSNRRSCHSCISDPLIHYSCHFSRTLHALCNVQSLITNGILRTIEIDDYPEESFTVE